MSTPFSPNSSPSSVTYNPLVFEIKIHVIPVLKDFLFQSIIETNNSLIILMQFTGQGSGNIIQTRHFQAMKNIVDHKATTRSAQRMLETQCIHSPGAGKSIHPS